MTITGLAFVLLGLISIDLPRISTVVVEQLVAWLLVVWGGLGIGFVASCRHLVGWVPTATSFAVVLIVGLCFVAFPVLGTEVMPTVLVVVFLLEGALQILVGLRLGRARWLLASSVASLPLGAILLLQ